MLNVSSTLSLRSIHPRSLYIPDSSPFYDFICSTPKTPDTTIRHVATIAVPNPMCSLNVGPSAPATVSFGDSAAKTMDPMNSNPAVTKKNQIVGSVEKKRNNLIA